jgi:chromosome segregation ATPase
MSEEKPSYNKLESRVKNVEQAIQLLTEPALRADERMDSFGEGLNNLTSKVEVLADAQIRTESSLENLSEALTNLAEALAHTDQRLDALIDIVRGRNGNT